MINPAFVDIEARFLTNGALFKMMKNYCVHVIPVGFEYDRVVAPILEYPADELILLRSSREEYPGQHALEEAFLEKLSYLPIPKRTVALDIYDLKAMFVSISKILSDELAKGRTVYINLSPAPKIELIALLMASSVPNQAGGIRLLYVKPREYMHSKIVDAAKAVASDPSDQTIGRLRSIIETFTAHGLAVEAKEIIELSPLPVESLSSTEKDILVTLREAPVESLQELVDRLSKGGRRVPRSNVVYHLEALKRKDLVSISSKGKKVRVDLLETGELFLDALLHMRQSHS